MAVKHILWDKWFSQDCNFMFTDKHEFILEQNPQPILTEWAGNENASVTENWIDFTQRTNSPGIKPD